MLFFLILLPIFSNCQRLNIDSLLQIVNSSKHDTDKVKASAQLGRYYLGKNNIDSAIFYNNKELEYSEHANWEAGKMSHLIGKSFIISKSGDYTKALDLLLEVLKLAEKSKDQWKISSIYQSLGRLYSISGNYQEAAKNYRRTLEIREQMNIAIDPEVISDMADAFYYDNSLDSALFYQNKALELSQKINYKRVIAISWCNLGNIYSKLSKVNIANSYYKKSLSYAMEMTFLNLASEINMGLANNYKILGKKDSSIYYARTAYYLANRSGFSPMLTKTTSFIKDHFKSENKLDSLSKYQELLILYSDSLYNSEKLKGVEKLRIDELYRQEGIKVQLKKQKELRKRNIQTALIALFIPIFGLLVFLLSRRKKKNTRVVLFLGITSLLMLFEFISLVSHPLIERITNHNVILIYLAILAIALILSPLHHKLEKFIKKKI